MSDNNKKSAEEYSIMYGTILSINENDIKVHENGVVEVNIDLAAAENDLKRVSYIDEDEADITEYIDVTVEVAYIDVSAAFESNNTNLSDIIKLCVLAKCTTKSKNMVIVVFEYSTSSVLFIGRHGPSSVWTRVIDPETGILLSDMAIDAIFTQKPVKVVIHLPHSMRKKYNTQKRAIAVWADMRHLECVQQK